MSLEQKTMADRVIITRGYSKTDSRLGVPWVLSAEFKIISMKYAPTISLSPQLRSNRIRANLFSPRNSFTYNVNAPVGWRKIGRSSYNRISRKEAI